jgi:hypothetical protein
MTIVGDKIKLNQSVDVIFDKDWLGFKKGQEFSMFGKFAEKLIKQGTAHLRDGSVVKEVKVRKLTKEVKDTMIEKEVIEEIVMNKDKDVEKVIDVKSLKQETKEFKRPEKDKMIKRATVSK